MFSWISVGIWPLGNIVYCLIKKMLLHCTAEMIISFPSFIGAGSSCTTGMLSFSLCLLFIFLPSSWWGCHCLLEKGLAQLSSATFLWGMCQEMCIWLEWCCIPDSPHSKHPLLTCSVLLPRQSCLRRKLWFHLWDFNFSYANCVCQLQNPAHWENIGNGKLSLLSM